MFHIDKFLRLLVLLGCIFCAAGLSAAGNDELISLEAEMLKYIETNDRGAFINAVEKLKTASKEAGDERMFYRAWGNQGIYESTHQSYAAALEIAKQMMEYARENGSIYGEYAAMHTRAMAQLPQQDSEAAQTSFLEAREVRRRHFPNESAAEDLRELMKIAYYRGNITLAKNYGHQLLAEPNVTAHHKGRALYRLCTMAFEENNVEEFNHIYEEMNRLMQTNGIKSINLFTELNYYIINGDYKQALLIVDRLSPDTCAERKALIYHRLGDNKKAYEYMVQYKQISDSIERASRAREVGNIYLRMNNDRLRLERELLSHQNSQLRYRFYFALILVVILLLLFVIYQRHKLVKLLRHDNTMLEFGKKGAERSLESLNELSFYESKTDLPLTSVVKVNKLCNHLANLTQEHCSSGVVTVFQTEFSDDFEIRTNPKALEKLLTLLLNDSSVFTRKGIIKLKCADAGENVNFSITDTSMGFGNKSNGQLSGLFGEEENAERYVSMNFNICQSISRLLHGRIWHDTEYTDGTRFLFEIPKEP